MAKKTKPNAETGDTPDPNDPRFIACLDLLGRTGAKSLEVRYQDDNDPVLWLVAAEWPHGRDAAGALNPLTAALRLLEAVLDGVGTCTHCGKTTAVSDRWDLPTFLDDALCWYVYDPEVKKFRRSCEGETEGREFGVDSEGNRVGRNDPCPCGSGKKWKVCHGA